MQYRGMMLSAEERLKLIEYQDALGVDIAQAAYPSAHTSEREILRRIYEETSKQGLRIRIAGLGRAVEKDADLIMDTGVNDIQLHVSINSGNATPGMKRLDQTVRHIRKRSQNACIEVSVLDLGKIDMGFLKKMVTAIVEETDVNILTLPDTSGILAPNLLSEKISRVAEWAKDSAVQIGVHCHNDMGMATANTIAGVSAGASVMEVAALGIGERNGIGDLFVAGKNLKEQGYTMNLKTESVDVFREYYAYLDGVCFKKTGMHLLNYNTPFFGRAVHTHVAGTHGQAGFGAGVGEDFYLNVLCGKHLAKKYMVKHGIEFEENRLPDIVSKIKTFSVEKGRSLTPEEVQRIALFSVQP